MACRLGSSDIRLKEGSFPRDTSIIIHTSIRLTITHSKFHSNLQGVQESTRKLLNISIYGPTSSIMLSAQLTRFRISNHPNNIRKIMSIFAVSKLLVKHREMIGHLWAQWSRQYTGIRGVIPNRLYCFQYSGYIIQIGPKQILCHFQMYWIDVCIWNQIVLILGDRKQPRLFLREMAWQRTGYKPLPEAIRRHYTLINYGMRWYISIFDIQTSYTHCNKHLRDVIKLPNAFWCIWIYNLAIYQEIWGLKPQHNSIFGILHLECLLAAYIYLLKFSYYRSWCQRTQACFCIMFVNAFFDAYILSWYIRGHKRWVS